MPVCPNCNNEIGIRPREFSRMVMHRIVFSCDKCKSPLKVSAKSYIILMAPILAVGMAVFIAGIGGGLLPAFDIKTPWILDEKRSPLALFFRASLLVFASWPISFGLWILLWWYKIAKFEFPDLKKPEIRPHFQRNIFVFFVVAIVLIVIIAFFLIK